MQGDDARGQIAVRHALEAGVAHPLGENRLARPGLDRIHQVLVRGGIRTRQTGEHGHAVLQVRGIPGPDERDRRVRELADHDAAARPGHAEELGERRGGVDDVAQTERDRDSVELVVAERKIGGVRLDELHVRVARLAPAPDLDHALREIRRDNPGTVPGQRSARGSRPGGDIEDPLARARADGPGRRHTPEGRVAHREDVVGPVVMGGHLIEHGGDLFGLLAEVGLTHPPSLGGSAFPCISTTDASAALGIPPPERAPQSPSGHASGPQHAGRRLDR